MVEWISYDEATTEHYWIIIHWPYETVRDATRPVLGDCNPAWDPAGNFLYFLSSRELEPNYDAGKLGMSFHGVYRPHALALRSDVPNPLLRAGPCTSPLPFLNA